MKALNIYFSIRVPHSCTEWHAIYATKLCAVCLSFCNAYSIADLPPFAAAVSRTNCSTNSSPHNDSQPSPIIHAFFTTIKPTIVATPSESYEATVEQSIRPTFKSTVHTTIISTDYPTHCAALGPSNCPTTSYPNSTAH